MFCCSAIASLVCGVEKVAMISPWILFSSVGGIFAGPITANQPLMAMFGKPCSA